MIKHMPFVAALAFAAALPAVPALAQVPESPVSITGTLVSASDDSVVISSKEGLVTVAMTPRWTVGVARRIAAADIKPGDFVATANTNVDAGSGRSTEVRIFEPGYEPEHGTHAMPRPGLSMTHGTVAAARSTADSVMLEVTYPGGSRHIVVPAGTGVTAYDLRSRSAAAPGVTVNVVTRKGSDGVPRAGRLLLVTP